MKPPLTLVLAASLLGLILAFCFGSVPAPQTVACCDDERPPIIVSNGG